MALLIRFEADLPTGERGGAKAVKEAQVALITIRDKACEADGYLMKGGSAEPMVVFGCKRFLTADRTNQLWGLVEVYR